MLIKKGVDVVYIIVRRKDFVKVYDQNKISKKEMSKIGKCEYATTLTETMDMLNEYNKATIFMELSYYFEDFIESIMPEIEEKTKDFVVDYIQNKHRLQVIRKSYSDKTETNVVKDCGNYLVKDLGKFNPLEFATLGDFLCEPTIEDNNGFQKSIGDCIIDAIQVNDEDISSVFTSKLKVSESQREFMEYFIKSGYFVSSVRIEMVEVIKNSTFDSLFGGFAKALFYDFFKKACEEKGIPVKNVEYIEGCNEHFKEIIFNAIYPIAEKHKKTMDNMPKQPNINRLNNKNNKVFLDTKKQPLPNSNRHINERLKTVRDCLVKALNYRICFKKYGMEEYTDLVRDMVEEIARVEAARYELQEICVDISEIVASRTCAADLLYNGLDYVMAYTYVNEETKKNIIDLIPDSPEKEYPEAREMSRHFILHYGPTNSGKTYQAIEALKHADSGIYLGPLRLLALEIQDTLMADGVLCSLLTGEEEDIVAGARHMASTVEKLDPTERYDVCVIDEAQMISDSERGFAWTRAVLGVQADTIHVCMAPEAKRIIKNLIDLCGDTYEEVEHTRRSELVVQKKDFRITPETVEEGDAYIVFSKKKVLQVAAELVKQGIKVSMIYGNLPYPVRKEQVRRFIEGNTKVVVSTNAIGMGINLPVRRIVFLENEKFNGTAMAPLTITDVKQIAGRAGRNKETGYVATTLGNSEEIERTLNQKTPPITNAYLGFSDVIISIDAPLTDILRVWRSIKPPKMFKRMDIDRYIYLNESVYVNVTKKQKLKMISIPFDERNRNLMEQWRGYCIAFEQKEEKLEPPVCGGTTLQHLEEYCQALDLWYSFCRNFGYDIDLEWLRSEKADTSEKINEILVKNVDVFQKKCECCGRPMHWSNPFKTCKKCNDVYRKMRY